MLREGYRVTSRMFRDSDQTVTVRWYKCPAGAQALGIPHFMRSLHWESHPYLFANGLGEVYPPDAKVFPWRTPIGVTGQHRCGSDSDFEHGGHYDPDAPPFPRADDGIGVCCRPPLGGLLIDGFGVGPPGLMTVWSESQVVSATGTTIFGPQITNVGTTGVQWVTAFFAATNQSAVDWVITPGAWHRVPLASRDTGLTWRLFWWDGGPTVAFFASGPVGHADTFTGQAPAWATRLIVAQDGGAILTDSLWYAAPHQIPPPP